MLNLNEHPHLIIFSEESLSEIPLSFLYYEEHFSPKEAEVISKGIFKFHESTQFYTTEYLISDFYKPISKLFKTSKKIDPEK